MMSSPLEAKALEALRSKGECGLLDAIDTLRSQGIGHYVSLPQLIVCGDQSSGKSSVLEAISGIPFPTRDNLCTRFATEVILRRSSDTGVSVSIVPAETRNEDERRRLLAFHETITTVDDFPDLTDKAKEIMELEDMTNAFAEDVEISGPGSGRRSGLPDKRFSNPGSALAICTPLSTPPSISASSSLISAPPIQQFINPTVLPAKSCVSHHAELRCQFGGH
jgi:hypothetical protein